MATLKSFYGVDIGEPSGSTAVATAEVVEVFELLKPKASKTPLIRIGGDIDGSYLVPDDLDGIAACFSPGVNRIKYFEDFLADRYGIQSHMCDFTCDVEELKTPLKPGMQTFIKKWLDVSPSEDSISLEDWLRDRDSQGDLLLQMDIEGAEYRNILATSEGTLARFRVIVLEVHGLGKMLEAPILREVIAPFFQKLARELHHGPRAPEQLLRGLHGPGYRHPDPERPGAHLHQERSLRARPRPGGAPPPAGREPQRAAQGATVPVGGVVRLPPSARVASQNPRGHASLPRGRRRLERRWRALGRAVPDHGEPPNSEHAGRTGAEAGWRPGRGRRAAGPTN